MLSVLIVISGFVEYNFFEDIDGGLRWDDVVVFFLNVFIVDWWYIVNKYFICLFSDLYLFFCNYFVGNYI